MLTKQTPPPGEIVVFGSSCTVYRDPRKKNLAQRAQQGIIVDVGEETKTLNKEQIESVQQLYLQDEVDGTEEESKETEPSSTDENSTTTSDSATSRMTGQGDNAGDATGRDKRWPADDTSAESTENAVGSEKEPTVGGRQAGEAASGNRRSKRRSKKKKDWTRERPVTRSVGRKSGGDAVARDVQEESGPDVVNSVVEPDHRNYREAVRSRRKVAWLKTIAEELQPLERN
ncbi:hypothetical protein PC128_g1833 [Phytophthora cactorum]|nr:hypothetical protein PC128_g1833 [Phytophthora cactorum]